MTVVHFSAGVLLVLSCLGYMLFVRSKLSMPLEFIPVFVFSSIACIVFLGGLAGQLFAVSVVVLLLGLLALVVTLIPRLRRRERFNVSFSLFQLAFLAGFLAFMLMLLQNRLMHYDNFSHWAIVIKVMLSTNAFPSPDAQLIEFKNYPLGVSSFIYYVCRFAGQSEAVMLTSQGLLIFSCFYAMFGIVSEKKRFLVYAFLGMGLSSLTIFNITIRITNLLVDFLLPIITLAIFAMVYRYRYEIKKACLTVLPLAGLLTVVKSTGIIFAVIGILFLIYTWLTHRSYSGWKSSWAAMMGVLGGALLPYIGWSWRMAAEFQGVDNKFDVTAEGLQGMGTSKTLEQMQEIISLFLRSSIDLTTRPALGIVVIHLAVIAATLIAVYGMKKQWNLWKALLALDIVMLLYYTGILGLYLFSMPLDEAIWLAGFERYASSIVVLFAGGLVLCAAIDLERSFHYKIGEVPEGRAFKSVRTKGYYQKGIIACTAIAVMLLLSEYNGIRAIEQSYETTLPYKIISVTGDRWYDSGQEDKSKYLLYASDKDQQVTNYYMQYAGRYFLYAPNVDGICCFNEDNMDNLLSGYDYLVVVESDAEGNRLLRKRYGIHMQEGIYRITRSESKITLTLL